MVSNKNTRPINFDRIIDNLNARDIVKGRIVIVHSSYDILESCGLSPEDINLKLLELVGSQGTLVMPVIRKFKEDGKLQEYLIQKDEDVICTYDVKRSKVVSGLLPFMLMQREDSVVSRFPLNPVVAVGKHAKPMVKNNLVGTKLSAHGLNSSWKYCVDHDAVVIGLGVEMPHYLTITHVNEDCTEKWPINNWYRKRKFNIIDGDFSVHKEVLERRPVWGAIYLAENKYRRDLIRNRILKVENIEGLDISTIESAELLSFLEKHPQCGYPYYI